MRLAALIHHSLEVVIVQFAHSFIDPLIKRGSRLGKSPDGVVFIRCLEGDFQLLDALV